MCQGIKVLEVIMNRKFLFALLLFVSFAHISLLPARAALPLLQESAAEELYYAFEMKGKLVGYGVDTVRPGRDGNPTVKRSHVILQLTALGQPFDVEILGVEEQDPETGKPLRVETDITQGSQQMGGTLIFEGNEVRFTPKTAGQPKTMILDPDVLVDDILDFPYLHRDMGPGKAEKKTYRILDLVECEIHEREFTWKGKEMLRFLGSEYDCMVFDSIDRKNGVSTKIWIDSATGRAVKSDTSVGIVSYLADASVKDRIERGDLDDSIFARVDVAIADFQSITYMKIKAKIRTAGEWITAESLNIPGQKFTGTVKDNLIDGIFEIEHQRYDGKNGPPFPPDFGGDEGLEKFLEPENLIESDDPVLVEKARAITEGSKDAWEAACRLSRWVAEEIKYEIPGGSARHTFDTGKGECGSHSRLLAAFCRAVGIPARIAAGCMYTPNYGGSFGQHAWNEIYMGDAGWITVDSTAMEVDYVDSGHIRLGIKTSFNPVEMEVLDYRAGETAGGITSSAGMGLKGAAPWKVGETYAFTYAYSGSIIGRETLVVKRFEEGDGGGVYSCASELDLTGAMTASSEWELAGDGRPIRFASKGKARGEAFAIDCRFSEGQVVEKVVKGENTFERTVELPENVFLIMNNCMGLLAFLAAAAPREEGQTCAFKFFHANTMQVLAAQVTPKGKETITWGGREVECRKLDFSLAGTPITMWVDEDGRLIRESEGGGALVMELEAKDARE
jgi:transglutaminase-like putative cysteine protease